MYLIYNKLNRVKKNQITLNERKKFSLDYLQSETSIKKIKCLKLISWLEKLYIFFNDNKDRFYKTI